MIVVAGLRRSYGAIEALRGVDLVVPRGAFYALVGANGAGKSTAVRILSGLISRDAGELLVLGLDPHRAGRELKRRIGVVPDFPTLYPELTPRENLFYTCRLREIGREEAAARLAELTEALGIDDALDQPCGRLSHGTLKKTALVAAMLHAPALLFLDEPFEGIDPVSTHAIRRLLDGLRQRGVTIFLTSHVMPMVEGMASRVAILDAGIIAFEGTVDQAVGSCASLEEAVLDRLGDGAAEPELAWYLL